MSAVRLICVPLPNKFKIKKNCNKKEKLCLCLWVSFDMGSASCWSGGKLLFSSVWAVFRNTFQPIQIHVKLHWSFTFHRLYQTTAVNGLWDTKRLRVCPHLLCEAKRSPSSRYTTLLLFENIFHDGLYCTFTWHVTVSPYDQSNVDIWPPSVFCMTYRSFSVTYFPYITASW